MAYVPHAYTVSAAEVKRQLAVPDGGLSETEVSVRRRQHGLNRLPEKPPTPLWRVLARQFNSPLIYVLAVAALVSLAIGEGTDAVFIAAVLLLNAVIGGVQEWKAEQSGHALQQLIRGRATVLRAGEILEIPAENLVPGDTVWLESGNRVPADLRLLLARACEVDESLLTGESLPVLKDPGWIGSGEASLGDRRNVAYGGSVVVRGRAEGIVVGIGSNTAVGQLALDVTSARGGRPPLLERIARFTRVIGVTVLVAAVLVGGFGVLVRGQGAPERVLSMCSIDQAREVEASAAAVRLGEQGFRVLASLPFRRCSRSGRLRSRLGRDDPPRTNRPGSDGGLQVALEGAKAFRPFQPSLISGAQRRIPR